jgi:hypothetical protein
VDTYREKQNVIKETGLNNRQTDREEQERKDNKWKNTVKEKIERDGVER